MPTYLICNRMPKKSVCFGFMSLIEHLFRVIQKLRSCWLFERYGRYYRIIVTSAFQRILRIVIVQSDGTFRSPAIFAPSRARRGAGVGVRQSCFVQEQKRCSDQGVQRSLLNLWYLFLHQSQLFTQITVGFHQFLNFGLGSGKCVFHLQELLH